MWGEAGLTAERFVADPFGPAGSRMYPHGRSGALASRRGVGLPRARRQPGEVRGFRIEAWRIEAALTRHPAVAQAAVIAREDQPAATSASSALRGGECRRAWRMRASCGAHLAERLPDYMVPSGFMFWIICRSRRTASSTRRALPAPEAAVAGVRRAPRSPQEEILCVAVCRRCSASERVGIDDNFFELGGHFAAGDPANQAASVSPWMWRLRSAACSRLRPWRVWPSVLPRRSGAARAGAPAASGRDPALVCAAPAVVPRPPGGAQRNPTTSRSRCG